jgi:hypothetical protein
MSMKAYFPSRMLIPYEVWTGLDGIMTTMQPVSAIVENPFFLNWYMASVRVSEAGISHPVLASPPPVHPPCHLTRDRQGSEGLAEKQEDLDQNGQMDVNISEIR